MISLLTSDIVKNALQYHAIIITQITFFVYIKIKENKSTVKKLDGA